MQLTALYHGLTREEVQAEVGSPLRLTDTIQETAAPTTEELRVIREEVNPVARRCIGEYVERATRTSGSSSSELIGDALLQARGENYLRDVHLAALGLNFETGNPKPRRLGRRLLHHGQMPRRMS